MAISAAIWAPEMLQLENLCLFIAGTAVAQLGVYAMMGNWLLKFSKRGMAASVSYAFRPFMVVIWMLFIVKPIGIELFIAIGSVLAVASLAAVALAHRRWCRAELE